MTVVMDDKDALDCTAHAKVLIVVLETLQTS
jgi:citrate lyase gamma subunit